MFDYASPSFKQSLAETIAWCAGQSLTAHPDESPDFRHRRTLYDESNRLFRAVYERFNRNWVKIRASAEWRQSEVLGKKADPLTLSSLDAQLRSPALMPSFQLDEFKDDLWDKAVSEVVAKRSAKLSNISINVDSQTQSGGRLLEFIPSETLMDGAAKYGSNGFFDVNNVPPWDIWVGFSDRTLVSWVPPALTELAQNGIDANPEGCIRWTE